MKHLLALILLALPLLSNSGMTQAAGSEIKKNFNVKPGGLLDVDGVRGSVRIETWKKSEVSIVVRTRERGSQQLSERNVHLEKQRNTIVIGGGKGQSDMNLEYNIRVPDAFDIEIDSKGGSVEIGDTLEGRIEVDSSGGSILIGDVDGSVNVATSGGSISVGSVTGESIMDTAGGSIDLAQGGTRVNADTSGGSITIGPSAGEVVVDTSGGSISVAYAKGDVTADTSGGSITLMGSDGDVNADTAGGSIHISDVKGSIVADTNGGGIKIRGAQGSVSADTNVGNISLEFIEPKPVKGTSIELSTNYGSINLALPSAIEANLSVEVNNSRRGDNEIDSEFPLTIERRARNIEATGAINGGGHKISLDTGYGNVQIRKLPD